MEAHRCPSLQFPLRHKAAILPLRGALQPVAVVQEKSVDHLPAMKSNKKLISFVKYQGLGNDFLLIDNRSTLDPKVSQDEAVKICNRNFGVGADGVIFAMPAVNGSDYSMRIFNSDGSEPEMCGNGIRCMARFVAKLEGISQPRSYNIHTLAGPIIPKLQADGQVAVDMGPPILNSINVPTKIPPTRDDVVIKAPLLIGQNKWIVTCVSMGNPHCITFGQEGAENLDLKSLKLSEIGPLFENHEAFPSRTNTEFVQVLSRSHLRMKVWERGAGATLACGTGACAVLVAAVLEGRADRECQVDLPGGPLEIKWKEENNHVYMTGPAEEVFIGTAYV